MELLAVIIILAVVVGISIPAVMSTVSNAKKKAFETAANTCADWIERQYQLYIIDSDQITNDTLKKMFNGKTPIKNFQGIVQEYGLKNQNVSEDSSWTIDKHGRVCLTLTALKDGDYYGLVEGNTMKGGVCHEENTTETTTTTTTSSTTTKTTTKNAAGETIISLKKLKTLKVFFYAIILLGDNMNNELIIGSHVGFNSKDQLLGATKEALSYKANTFMFYTGAPQNTKRNAINDEYTYEAYKLMKENNIALENIIVHAPYIVNLGNLENFDFSVNFLKEEVKRVATLGVKYMVLHPGSSVSYPREDSINSIIDGLNIILDNPYDVTILLETMAGKGSEIGCTLEEMKTLIDGVKFKNKIGVCLDTCHLHDSGVDLTKFDEYLELFDKEIGLAYIHCIHINDSKNTISSHKDRHENIGFGNIGFDNLMKIIYHEKLKNIPKLLETPYVTENDESKEKIYPPYAEEIEMIRNKCFDENLITKIRN